MGVTSLTPFLVVHILFKALQGTSLITSLVALLGGYFTGTGYERLLLCNDLSLRFGFWAVTALSLFQTIQLEEQVPSRAERLRVNWRQQLVDALSLFFALLGAIILPGSSLFGKFSLGAAIGTVSYSAIMPLLPEYDVRKVFAGKIPPNNPPGLTFKQILLTMFCLWINAFVCFYLASSSRSY